MSVWIAGPALVTQQRSSRWQRHLWSYIHCLCSRFRSAKHCNQSKQLIVIKSRCHSPKSVNQGNCQTAIVYVLWIGYIHGNFTGRAQHYSWCRFQWVRLNQDCAFNGKYHDLNCKVKIIWLECREYLENMLVCCADLNGWQFSFCEIRTWIGWGRVIHT